MIVYLDASAIVKRYLAEAGSAAVDRLIAQAQVLGTSLISRAEVAAALARATRLGVVRSPEVEKARELFEAEWADWVTTPVTNSLVIRADALAWQHSPRGYDAVHLASCLLWLEGLGERVKLATFDRELWQAGQAVGLEVWPSSLP
jgi:predicted nucleic acid-binding protein